MDSSVPQIPNLASILQTLSAYAPPRPAVEPEPSQIEEGEYDPSQYDPAQPSSDPLVTDPEPSSTSFMIRPPSQISQKKLNPPSVLAKTALPPSASSITTWPKALDFTVLHIFSDPSKKQRIRRLMENQHTHERQWWASREELIRKAQGRDKSRMQLDSILASVGGVVATTSHLQGKTEGDEISKELAVFDRKVHRACREMIEASKKELWDLGVPFFCAGINDKIERKNLEVLRKKMLTFLEDYCDNQDEKG